MEAQEPILHGDRQKKEKEETKVIRGGDEDIKLLLGYRIHPSVTGSAADKSSRGEVRGGFIYFGLDSKMIYRRLETAVSLRTPF